MKREFSLKIVFVFLMMLLVPVVARAEIDNNFFVPEYTESYKKWMALSEEEKQKVIEPQMYENIQENIETFSTYSLDNNMVGEILPEKYSREYYGKLRAQDSNLCWACSSANAFETNYFLTNNVKKFFSDMHMEYMTSNTYNSKGFNRRFNIGGNINIALAYATNGMGIINDETVTASNFKDKTISAKVSDYDVVSTANIKKYIYNYGVVSAYTYINNGYFSSSNLYNNRDLAYCCSTPGLTPNHAVTIIGWDDNYTHSAFPRRKGAYIALNSYGSAFGNNGLYHIFYDDVFVSDAEFYFVTKTTDIDYTNLYQHDEYGSTATIGWNVANGGTYAANVFKRNTSKEEKLTKLGIVFPNNENLTVYINANGDEKNISKATYVFKTGTKTAGYHTIELPKAVTLSNNKFTIGVKYQGFMGTELASSDSSSWWYTANCNVGESFISKDGKDWTDLKTVAALGSNGANACIKAFTVSEEDKTDNNNNNIVKPKPVEYSADLINYVFDYQYYAEHNIDLYRAYGYNMSALKNHWEKYGKAEGRAASPIFNARYYVENNKDVKNAYGNNYVEAYNHFMKNGYKEYRKSSIEYDGKFYKNNYSDLGDMTSMELIRHYSLYGKPELRQANTNYDIINILFDSSIYSKANPDLSAAFGNNESRLKDHWLRYGIAEGRISSLIFDAKYYLQINADVKKAVGNNYLAAFNHFITNGFAEKRQASAVFSVKEYLKNNTDIQKEFGTNYLKIINHFEKIGKNQDRLTSSTFYIGAYKSKNADLAKVYKNNYENYYMHYELYGMKEKRVCK